MACKVIWVGVHSLFREFHGQVDLSRMKIIIGSGRVGIGVVRVQVQGPVRIFERLFEAIGVRVEVTQNCKGRDKARVDGERPLSQIYRQIRARRTALRKLGEGLLEEKSRLEAVRLPAKNSVPVPKHELGTDIGDDVEGNAVLDRK